MRLCIFGSRNVDPTPEEIDAAINDFFAKRINDGGDNATWRDVTVVLCGQATGADSAGERWARQRGIKVEPYPIKRNAGMSKWGFTQAAYARNRLMASVCDVAIGWWKGQSGGTANMAAHCAVLGKPCVLVEVE